jgi:ketosteroid isomerase-like protein
MGEGAITPEELDALMEDAVVLRSGRAVAALFEEGGLLAVDAEAPPARGERQIARAAAAIWDGASTYVAEPRRVLQARDTALVVAARALHVTRRAPDGRWRLAVSLVRPCRRHIREEDP